MVKFGQGAKQLYFQAGAKLGWSSQAEMQAYTAIVNEETALYNSGPAAQSTTGQITEFIADACIYIFVPGGAGLRGARLIIGCAASGGLIGALQPVSDGRLMSRLHNATAGAVVGGIAGPIVTKVARGIADSSAKSGIFSSL